MCFCSISAKLAILKEAGTSMEGSLKVLSISILTLSLLRLAFYYVFGF